MTQPNPPRKDFDRDHGWPPLPPSFDSEAEADFKADKIREATFWRHIRYWLFCLGLALVAWAAVSGK